tara:strand:- start:2756 stop:4861 length:2106 start_codon:yes stop_codon:yes gene_type:complete
MKFLQGPRDNIVDSLYTPGFKDCKVYRRQTAFFQPSVFKCWGKSIQDIVENETKLEILMGVSESNSKILEAINNLQTKEEKNRLLAKEANNIFEKCLGLAAESPDHKQRIRLIRYLYAKELLEIKLCVSCDENQENFSLAHNKIGYFMKEDKSFTSFMGSMNESDSAIMRNGEDLVVYDSRSEMDSEGASKLKKSLDEKWSENDPFNIVFSPTKEFTEKMKKNSDVKDKTEALKITKEILLDLGIIQVEKKELRTLRDHQKRAIRNWEKNGKVGILDHATGSGKTFTALKTIQAVRKDINQLFVIIGVPYIPLADQWLDELNEHFKEVSKEEKFIFNSCIGCYSGEGNWKSKIEKEILQFRNSIQSKKPHLSVILAVNRTLVSEDFQQTLKSLDIRSERLFFIGDECHRYASKLTFDAVPESARYRLGLSATAFNDPENLSPNEKKVEEYFGGICDEYSLKDGIKDGHLCEYYYKPISCFLDEEEFFEWQDYLNNYNPALNVTSKDENEQIKVMEKVIEGSKEKFIQFEKLIKDMSLEEKKFSLVFCGEGKKDGERQIEYVQELLNKNDWTYQVISAEESRQERKDIILGFQRGDIQSITAMRVLDEGVDIPVIKQAIILASSTKRRQFVQRRGRVLRKNDDKDHAVIYDFIVLPPAKYSKKGQRIIDNEIHRVKQMGEDALNKKEIDKFISNLETLHGIN